MITTINRATLGEMQRLLIGAISGGRKSIAGGKVLGLHGKTLIFNDPLIPANPLGTVTFDDPGGTGLTPAEINTQLHDAGLPGPTPLDIYTAQFSDGTMSLIEITPTNGILLMGTGTANPVFGFGSDDILSRVYNPYDGAAPRLINLLTSAQADGYYATVELP